MKLRVLFALLLLLPCRAIADSKGTAHIPLPADFTGTLDGTAYKIRVPANWNGTLLVYTHPTATGTPILDVAPAAYPAPTALLEDQLLALGYAVAGSGYGSSEQFAVLSTVALTTYFREAVGNPRRTIVWGNSGGAVVALKLIEKYPGIYDAAIANCAPDTGTPENMDSALAFSLAYAAAFGWHDEAWGPISNLRDGLKVLTDVVPLMIADRAYPPNRSPGTYGRWEFIRSVMHMPSEAFWGSDPQQPFPFFAMQMWKATERRAAIEADYGGPIAGNLGAHYWLDPADELSLSTTYGVYGVNPGDLLEFMNDRTNISGDIAARNHAEHWGAFTGVLRRPVLTMHATFDGLALTPSESYYNDLVTAAGCSDQLMQVFVNTVGHCRFSAEQYLTALSGMVTWLDTGAAPDGSAFPATKGFQPGYVLKPWVF